MPRAVFDPDEFREMYPQFGPDALTDGQLRQAWNAACLLLDNTDASVVRDVEERKTLLHLVVCHLATLALWGANGQTRPMTSASQGSVSVSFAAPPRADGNYWRLTPCGETFSQAIRKYVAGGRQYAARPHHPWG